MFLNNVSIKSKDRFRFKGIGGIEGLVIVIIIQRFEHRGDFARMLRLHTSTRLTM